MGVCSEAKPRNFRPVKTLLLFYLCISQFQLRPSPPGNCGAFVHPVSSGGGALANLAGPRGRAFAYAGATPGILTHSFFSDSKSKHGGFYRKGPAVSRRLDRPSWTGQTSGGFLDFMHFFIAYQGTTWAITIYSEIGNDQRESTYACFFDQGFK